MRVSHNPVSDRLTRRDMYLLCHNKKSAYPAHTRELDEDEDDRPLVRPDRPTVSADEYDKPLVQPA